VKLTIISNEEKNMFQLIEVMHAEVSFVCMKFCFYKLALYIIYINFRLNVQL